MLKALLEKRAKLVADMKAIITAAEDGEGRELTAEEQTSFDAIKADKEKLDKRIANADYMEGASAELTERRGAIASRAGITRTPGPEARREFETLGEFLHAVRFNQNDQRLNFVEGVGAAGNDMDLSAEMRMDNAPSGGFMVPPQLRTQILSVDPQDALVRPRANVLEAGDPPDSRSRFRRSTRPARPITCSAACHRLLDRGRRDEARNASCHLRNVTLTPHEVAGYITVTDKLLAQLAGGRRLLSRGLLRSAVNAAEDYAFLRGTGISQPLGVINAGATYFVHRAGSNAIAYADVLGMVARLLMRGNVNSPIWSMPQQALASDRDDDRS
jgi:HK97 family phage major capsid protein